MKNPSAFPKSTEFREGWGKDDIYEYGESGMSLLDYFAGNIAQGISANPDLSINDDEDFKSVAVDSYKIAEAMLKERENHL